MVTCKVPNDWLQFIHEPDDISGDILTVVYIVCSLQHILYIVQLIAYKLQLMNHILQLMWSCSRFSYDAGFKEVGIFFGSYMDHYKDPYYWIERLYMWITYSPVSNSRHSLTIYYRRNINAFLLLSASILWRFPGGSRAKVQSRDSGKDWWTQLSEEIAKCEARFTKHQIITILKSDKYVCRDAGIYEASN